MDIYSQIKHTHLFLQAITMFLRVILKDKLNKKYINLKHRPNADSWKNVGQISVSDITNYQNVYWILKD